MAETKSSSTPKPKSSGDPSQSGEFVAEGDDAREAGYWGTRNNPHPDEAFALTTGPDAPVTDMKGQPVDVEQHIEKGPKE